MDLMLTDPAGPLSYIFILLLILLSAFFAGTESAFSYCNTYRIEAWADNGNRLAKLSNRIINKFDDAIITILIATNILHVAASTLATLLFVKMMGESGSIVSTIIVTILIFMFAEILPKNIAKANSDKWCLVSSMFLYFFYIVLWPIVKVLDFIMFLIKKLFKLNNNDSKVTEDDFMETIGEKQDKGEIDEEEEEILYAAVEFGNKVVSDVLTKKEDIVALDINKCNNKYLQKFLSKITFSRIPVYQGSIDNIIGILHVRTYLKELWKDKNVKVKDTLLPPLIVSPQVKIDELLEQLKKKKNHIAIVKQKSRTIGMVTMKDILEELVSDIDESGTGDEEDNK